MKSLPSRRFGNVIPIAVITVTSGLDTQTRVMGHFSIALTPKPRLYAVVKKRNFVCGLNCNNSSYNNSR